MRSRSDFVIKDGEGKFLSWGVPVTQVLRSLMSVKGWSNLVTWV